jgi:hypothetical protein
VTVPWPLQSEVELGTRNPEAEPLVATATTGTTAPGSYGTSPAEKMGTTREAVEEADSVKEAVEEPPPPYVESEIEAEPGGTAAPPRGDAP